MTIGYQTLQAINTVQKAQIMDQQIQKQGIIQSILSGKLPILQHNLSLVRSKGSPGAQLLVI